MKTPPGDLPGEVLFTNFLNGDKMKKRLFVYTTTVQTVASAGGTANPTINLSNDYDFELFQIRGSLIMDTAPDGEILAQLQVSNGDLWSNAPIDLLAVASSQQANFSGIPVELPTPMIIEKNSKIVVNLTNNDSATDVKVQVQLWGFKLIP